MGTLLAKDSFAEYLGEGDDPAPAEIQYVPFGEGK
jgi:hypothetical protein